jgi:hypothetical protein
MVNLYMDTEEQKQNQEGNEKKRRNVANNE